MRKKLLCRIIKVVCAYLLTVLFIVLTPILSIAWLVAMVVRRIKPKKYDTVRQACDETVGKFSSEFWGCNGKYTPTVKLFIQKVFNEAERAMKYEMEKYPASKMRVEKQLNALTTIRGYFASKRWDISEYLE